MRKGEARCIRDYFIGSQDAKKAHYVLVIRIGMEVPKEKFFQTPYGEVLLARYAYQKAGGGKTVCRLEQGAHILRNATPRFAKMVAHKLAQNAALDVQRDLEEKHARPVSKLLVQELGAYASAVVQAREETWTWLIIVDDMRVYRPSRSGGPSRSDIAQPFLLSGRLHGKHTLCSRITDANSSSDITTSAPSIANACGILNDDVAKRIA
jgi:hypothetical protein